MTGRHWLTELFPLTRLSALVLYHCMKFVLFGPGGEKRKATHKCVVQSDAKTPIWARKSLAVCIMQQAAKPSVEGDWFGFTFVWLGPASEYFHCFEVSVFVSKRPSALIYIFAAPLHRPPWIMLTAPTEVCAAGLNLHDARCLPTYKALLLLCCGGNSWESTLLNRRLS